MLNDVSVGYDMYLLLTKFREQDATRNEIILEKIEEGLVSSDGKT